MGDFSRDTFKLTNVMHQLITGETVTNPRHYVGARLQQGVPVLDADWNELEDIRRIELETILVRAIGNGVPVGSDGFRIREAGTPNNFLIEAGLLFFDGWLVYNGNNVDYVNQPHRNSTGVSPPLPVLQNAPGARRELVYLDAWEREVNSLEDEKLVNPNIGVETCVRLERAWVVRMETITADPLDPATIPNRQAGHRYYPLASIDRPAGGQISQGMITDLRRTHLTLAALTHAPLLIDDTVRGQRLDSSRLASVFRENLNVMDDVLNRSPEVFVYENLSNLRQTLQAMSAYQDVRASATSFEHQASNQLLHKQAASGAMDSFYQVQKKLMDTLQQFVTSGVAGVPTQDFLSIYKPHLDGTSDTDKDSLKFAVTANDLLGAVMAQERLNEALGLQSDTLPEGNVTANLISITPSGVLVANTNYQLTIRIQSGLESAQGSEQIRAIVSAGVGWTLRFQGTIQPDPREIVVTVPNQESQDVVLFISAAPGAANTTLNLSVRPERRQQLVYTHPPVTLALGQEVLPTTVIATLNYQPPPVLQPGNVSNVARSVMAQPGGVNRTFSITNLSTQQEQYQLTVTAQSTATGWQTPNQPILAPMNPGDSRNVTISFRITDEAGAVSPLTYRLQLVRVTGGVNVPLANTLFDITFNLTS